MNIAWTTVLVRNPQAQIFPRPIGVGTLEPEDQVLCLSVPIFFMEKFTELVAELRN